MNIHEKGINVATIKDIVKMVEEQLKTKYGNDFHIKPEGVIDNIATVCAFLYNDLQKEMVNLATQFDPLSATGIWQDALYERIGCKRIGAQKTNFSLKILGAPNISCPAGAIHISTPKNEEEFINTYAITTNDNGEAITNFECVQYGAIEVSTSDEFKIISAPDGIEAVVQTDDLQYIQGRDRETDDEFRKRFITSKSLNARASYNANIANLVKYVDDIKFLKIIDVKNDPSFEPGTAQIIAHHNTTDNIFANAIFDTIAAGIELLGNTEVIVNDIEGTPHTVRFHKAEEVPLTISANIKIKNGYYQNSVCSEIKTKILDYVNEHVYGLEETIYANEFIIPILSTDGVAAVTDIKIKKAEDEEFTDSVALTREQIPIFLTENFVIFV